MRVKQTSFIIDLRGLMKKIFSLRKKSISKVDRHWLKKNYNNTDEVPNRVLLGDFLTLLSYHMKISA